jgi:hypothetical protein
LTELLVDDDDALVLHGVEGVAVDETPAELVVTMLAGLVTVPRR